MIFAIPNYLLILIVIRISVRALSGRTYVLIDLAAVSSILFFLNFIFFLAAAVKADAVAPALLDVRARARGRA